MTSRERVRAVLNHELPDRVPNGLGGCETEGLHIVAYDNLQKILGVEAQPPRLDTFMTNAVFEEPVIRAMDGDIILLASPRMCASELRGDTAGQWKEQELWGRTFRVASRERFRTNDDGTVTWETAGNAICPAGAFFFDHKGNTDLMADFGVPDPDAFHPYDTFDERFLRNLENAAKRLYEETDLSLCLGETITDLQIAPGGMIGSMVLMMEEPDVMRALLDKCADAALKQIKLLDQAVGKYVDILSIAHDFGDNRGVTIGEHLWRDIYKDAYRKLFRGWQEITDMKVNLHSCGSIDTILPDLIECGVQVVNPVQVSAKNMGPANLKERFGNDVIFWGGAYDVQLMNDRMTYDEVYRAVSENIRTLGAGGNYIFSGVHNLPATMPEHHLKAMIDAYRDTRDYR
jgi:uroporphyrinogen decarboxylase